MREQHQARPLLTAGASLGKVEVSIVVPMYNEVESVDSMYSALTETLDDIDLPYEIIVVDDGSTDGTFGRLAALAATDPRLRLIKLRRNFGQTAAMSAGFDHARGAIVASLDGDLQNDPADIPLLLAKLDEGYDVVSGWRRDRQDSALRRLPSRVANRLIGAVTGVSLHDYGCTLKAYRAEILRDTRLYGEMHRFLPALAHLAGGRIAEVPVRHHARRFGQSKYGLRRTGKVFLDLITVKFLSGYATKPSYVFGGSGVVFCILGFAAAVFTAYERFVNHVYVYKDPALIVAVFLLIIGIQLILMGLLAELIVRTYHESQSKPTYSVREFRNFDEAPPLP